ncbi:MAG: DUF1211 domain-containing protein [Eubacterium sp.]|nr:DUF1211 domain-containing protein [Eubacterium sp.]
MKKERLVAFTDAVLAIIMTILVLELEKPEDISFEGFWALRSNLFAYMLSFFWIGSLWIALNSIWENVERVSGVVAWWNVIFLFFTSFLPYATGLVSNNFYDREAQAFYGIVVIAASTSNWILNKLIDRPNSDNPKLLMATKGYRMALLPDILLKVVSLILALTVYPPIMMYGVLFCCGYFQIAKAIIYRRQKKKSQV